jgi:hypothetical protein
LTVPQLCLELNVDDSDEVPPDIKHRLARFAGFDELCDRNNLTPAALSVKPIDEVVPLLRGALMAMRKRNGTEKNANGTPRRLEIDLATLPNHIAEYYKFKCRSSE